MLGSIWRIGRWVLLVIALAFVAFVLFRVPAVEEKQHSDQVVAQIKAQRLTMSDVDGKHLPPPPDPAKVDATVAGIDANQNGIRDDVELAIFKKYPGDANLKLRAAELQYAMTEQMFLGDVFDTSTWKAVAEQDNRAYQCIVRNVPNSSGSKITEVEGLVRNTSKREAVFQRMFDFETSFGLPPGEVCDIKQKSPN